MTAENKGRLVASKSGYISASQLISENDDVWVVLIEKNVVEISKSSTFKKVFINMSDALKWTRADKKLIAHFAEQEKLKLSVVND
ncbi:hypothetical protein RYA05_02870 [Pseudomonas syringae pv. actinidiae]|nr:hypothetical protein [Pseudomonas syringae pv. actinidiae]